MGLTALKHKEFLQKQNYWRERICFNDGLELKSRIMIDYCDKGEKSEKLKE
jgi:hypothetical protein